MLIGTSDDLVIGSFEIESGFTSPDDPIAR
jgi:hypothetical protein